MRVMTVSATPTQERRQFPRSELPRRVEINLLQPSATVSPHSVNFSEGGLCLRLQELLEVRSLVRLQLTPERAGSVKSRSLECTGRVAWIIQRLDLRDAPPFLYDVGIQFVDPPPLLRQLMARQGDHIASKMPSGGVRALESCLSRGRRFLPRLERQAQRPPRWHLVVSVDGVPCFSGHYPSERAALAAWERFKRQRTKR